MTRSSRFFAILTVACMAAASAFSAAADRVVAAVRTGFGFLIGAWVDPLVDKPKNPGQEKPRVALVAAKSFVLRLLKRRPTVHPSWRMCPSI